VDGYFERGQQSLTRRETDSLPISPIERYWPGSDFTSRCEFAGWIPESWHENSDVSNAKALEWLVFRWKGSPKYQRLSEDFFDDEMNEAFCDFVQRYLALLKLEQHGRTRTVLHSGRGVARVGCLGLGTWVR
jgi:hypothetical protein